MESKVDSDTLLIVDDTKEKTIANTSVNSNWTDVS